MSTVVEWEDVSKQYSSGFSTVTALDEFSFQLDSGQTAGIVGPQASGKTTIAQTLLGNVRVSSGTVTLFQQPPTTPISREKVGYLPTYFDVFSDETVDTILQTLARLKGIEEANNQLKNLCEALHLTQLQNQPLNQCSPGQRKRVGIAQALLGRPDLLVLDEPTVDLEPNAQATLHDMIEQRSEQEQTTLILTNRMNELKQQCERACVLSDGEVTARGTPTMVIDHLRDSNGESPGMSSDA